MKISGRNKLKGKVTNIKEGVVTAQVEADIGAGNTVLGVITMDSLKDLDIKVGDEITALVKATSVMFIK
jgi:molybdopterin-binding protein